jgi:hypothetical protein
VRTPPRRADHVVEARLGDVLVLLDRARARLHLLNGSAAAIWERVDGVRTVAEIAGDVAAQVGVAVDQVEADVRVAMEDLAEAGVLAGEEPPNAWDDAAVRLLRREGEGWGLDLPHDCLLLHGGAVAARDGSCAIAIVGESGAGKSTTTAHLVASGWGYLSDEVVVLGDDLRVEAHHRPIEVTAASLDLLGADVAATAIDGGRKRRLPAELMAGGAHAGGLPLGLVVVPDTTPGAEFAVLEPLEALEVLASSSFNIVALDDGLDQLVRMVASIPVVRIPTIPLGDVATRVTEVLAAPTR